MQLRSIGKKIQKCLQCGLCKTATHVVPGEGNPDADLMFIGEAPGKNEDLQGRPFVGASGKFLTHLIESIGLKREDVFITSVVKCRPPQNRDPKPQEIEACWPWLAHQIKSIKPKVIVTLGRHSMNRFIPGARISEIHGQPVTKTIKPFGTITIFPSYHPAAALYAQKLRHPLMDDFKKIKKILKKQSADK